MTTWVFLASPTATPEHVHTRDELIHREGFGQIIIRAAIQPAQTALHIAMRGQHDHAGRRLRLPQPRQNGETIHRRQIHIQHDQVWPAVQRHFERLLAIVAHLRRVTAARQGPRDVAGEIRFIFYNKYLHGNVSADSTVSALRVESQIRNRIVTDW